METTTDERAEPGFGPYILRDAPGTLTRLSAVWLFVVLSANALAVAVEGRFWDEDVLGVTLFAAFAVSIFCTVTLAVNSALAHQRRTAGQEYFGPGQLFWVVRHKHEPHVVGVLGADLALVPMRPRSNPPVLWSAHRQRWPLAEVTAIEEASVPGIGRLIRGTGGLRFFLASGEHFDVELWGAARALRLFRARLGEEGETPAPALRPEGEEAPEIPVDPLLLRRRIDDQLGLDAQDVAILSADPKQAELVLRSVPRPLVPGEVKQILPRPSEERLIALATASARAALLAQGNGDPARVVRLLYASQRPAVGGEVEAEGRVQGKLGDGWQVHSVLYQTVAGRRCAIAHATLTLGESEED